MSKYLFTDGTSVVYKRDPNLVSTFGNQRVPFHWFLLILSAFLLIWLTWFFKRTWGLGTWSKPDIQYWTLDIRMSNVQYRISSSWWRHIMETFSALLAICAENSPVPGEFPAQRRVTRSFDVFFDLRPNKRLNKQSWGWWSETPSSSLWRHRNVTSRSWRCLKLSLVDREVNYCQT